MKTPLLQKGFSLIEMLVYLAVLSLVFIVVVSTILSFTSNYRQLAVHRIIEHSAMGSLERLTRDIRAATDIDMINSTFGSNNDILTLVTNDNGVATTTKFYVQNNVLNIDQNNIYLGPLTTTNVSVTNLTFTHLTGSTTQGIKIDMTLQGTNGPVTQTNNYHTTVILKGS